MNDSQTLSDAVSSIEAKAREKENAEQVDQKVDRAMSLVSSLNSNLSSLEESVGNLQFYRRVLDEGFDTTPPDDRAVQKARTAVDCDRDQLVRSLVDAGLQAGQTTSGSMSGGAEFDAVRSDVREAQSSVNSAIETAKSQLRRERDEWTSKLDSAKELQTIIGTQDQDFSQTVKWIKRLVTKDIFDPSKSAATVVNEWQNARDRWEASEDLHGTDAFQTEHGLSQDAMDAISSLSQRSQLSLDDMDIETLRELKSVPELAEAVKLRI
jgi:hypothetical protein